MTARTSSGSWQPRVKADWWRPPRGLRGRGSSRPWSRANALAVVGGDEGAIPPGGLVTLHMTDLPEDH